MKVVFWATAKYCDVRCGTVPTSLHNDSFRNSDLAKLWSDTTA